MLSCRVILLSFALCAACTEIEVIETSGSFGLDTDVPRTSVFRSGRRVQEEASRSARPGALSRGTDQFLNQNRRRNAPSQAIIVPGDGELVEVSLINASISSAAQAVLGDALGKRFTVSNKLDGTITIQSTGAIPKQALLELFEAALSANGARLEQDGETLKVVPGSTGNTSFRLAKNGVGDGAAVIVAPLKFISATQMVALLEPLTSEGLRAAGDKKRNLVMLSGTPEQLEGALDALNLFDVDVLQGKSVAIVELSSADPEAIVDELKTLFETEEGGSLEGVIEFVPNTRLGSVLVITSRNRYLTRAQKWIRELDRTASGRETYIEIYELQNRSAAEVAPMLNQLLTASNGANSTGQEDGGDSEAAQSGGTKVTADEGRNAILVRATRPEHREIRGLMRELDTAVQQVMLEATIAEVTLNDELELGVRWFFQEGNFDATFSDVTSGAVGSSFPGFSAIFGHESAKVALNALAGVTDVRVISSPTLMVADNEEAVLQIGDQVPVATQTSTSNSSEDAPTVTTIEFRDTGVILTVTPNISRNGRVVLDIEQEVSSVAATQTSGIDSPTIRQRRISTNVILQNGTTLALGGLIEESSTKTISKVPGLGDAPVIGGLFRNTERGSRRSELLILIRPIVVTTQEDAITVTEYWRNKLSSSNSVIDSGLARPNHAVGGLKAE